MRLIEQQFQLLVYCELVPVLIHVVVFVHNFIVQCFNGLFAFYTLKISILHIENPDVFNLTHWILRNNILGESHNVFAFDVRKVNWNFI